MNISLTEIALPESLRIIYGFADDGCAELVRVTIYAEIEIGIFAFKDTAQIIDIKP